VERSRRTLRDHARRIRRNYAIRSRTRRVSRLLEANPASARRDLRNFRASRSPVPLPRAGMPLSSVSRLGACVGHPRIRVIREGAGQGRVSRNPADCPRRDFVASLYRGRHRPGRFRRAGQPPPNDSRVTGPSYDSTLGSLSRAIRSITSDLLRIIRRNIVAARLNSDALVLFYVSRDSTPRSGDPSDPHRFRFTDVSDAQLIPSFAACTMKMDLEEPVLQRRLHDAMVMPCPRGPSTDIAESEAYNSVSGERRRANYYCDACYCIVLAFAATPPKQRKVEA